MIVMAVDRDISRLAELYRDEKQKEKFFAEIIKYEIDQQLGRFPIFKDEKIIHRAIACNTALHLAMEMNDEKYIEALLDNGADFTIRNSLGHTAVLQHIEEDKLYYMVDGDKPHDYYALHKYKGRISHRINLVLSAHVKNEVPTNPCSFNGITHFHAACMLNNVEAVLYFLKNGVSQNESANADSTVLPGYAPLHFAARYLSIEVAKILLSKGAQIDVKDAEGQTPLEMLVMRSMEVIDGIRMGKGSPYKQAIVELNKNKCIIEMILKTMSDTEHVVLATSDDQLENSFGTRLLIEIRKSLWTGHTPQSRRQFNIIASAVQASWM